MTALSSSQNVMLEFLRKHQGTMWIIITVVVIIAFTFFGNAPNPSGSGQPTGADTAFNVYGRDYSFADFTKLQSFYTLGSALRLTAGRESWADMLGYMAQRYQSQSREPMDFAFNLLVLREELKKNGIHVSDEEVKAAFKKLPALQSETGFDAGRAEFIQNQLGSMGFTTADLYDLLRDWLGFQKLQTLVSGSYVTSDFVSKQLYAATFQTIKASSIPFALETFKKSAQVTDDEVKKYHEENKDNFKTTEKRAISYIFLAKPDVEKLNAEDTVKARNAYGEKVNNLALAVIQPDAKFEDEAKKAGAEVKTLPAFSMDAPPEELKEESTLVRAVFSNIPKTHPVSDPVEGSKGYFLFKVTEVQDPKLKEFAEVQGTIKDTLIAQKAQEAMTKAANEARKKLEEAIKGGKKFEDAAKEAGLEPQSLVEFSPANPPSDLANGREIAFEARITPAGSFTKPLTTETGIMLVYVQAKELRKREDSATMKGNLDERLSNMGQMDVFSAWFDRRRDEANVKADALVQREMTRS
jgi:hypothetical protein